MDEIHENVRRFLDLLDRSIYQIRKLTDKVGGLDPSTLVRLDAQVQKSNLASDIHRLSGAAG